jgi:hypothetical protein
MFSCKAWGFCPACHAKRFESGQGHSTAFPLQEILKRRTGYQRSESSIWHYQ